MLLDFTVANFGPFKGEATLSMHKTKVSEHPGNVLTTSDPSGKLLSSALIFGPNATGKTFLTDAFYILRQIVAEVDPKGISPAFYLPYKVTSESRTSPVHMRIRLKIDGILYNYSIDYLAGVVVKESLYHYPNGRQARVFIRTGPTEFDFAKKRIAGITTPNRTYLAMAAVNSDPVCSRFQHAMINDIIVLSTDPSILVSRSCEYGGRVPERKAQLVRALGTADLGINDFTFKENTKKLSEIRSQVPPDLYEAAAREMDTFTTMDIFLRHDFEGEGIDEEGRTFPMDLESDGTKCIFGLMGPLIDALENGKLVVMDELGSHLHPMITRWIVKQFADPNNPNGAQLVANTHDISLMDIDELLRRDQIWFVNKDRKTGASELYCLSDFDGVRKDTDVMRRYLDGRYDAVPVVRHRGVI